MCGSDMETESKYADVHGMADMLRSERSGNSSV